ncbi:MAG: phosphatidylserine decarboxylase [Arenimonas sp. SCN 70-307]|uniref:archaetidylserine decarboxylase n=1 Tax=Arenimonas sp. SCN 70-307 TaxID=1660089 RepID=UPI00086EB493|nr:archaetidylserine decarboxylase [Arenimonas sp. SCN 70-307]ODS62515.1 MAG: phosphatidylserine decarboxylase [Arenimonas sp. SCN 70-307]
MSPKVALQYLLPHRLLSRLAYGVARSRAVWFKDWLIGLVIRKFKVDMAEAADPEPRNYPHFNAFFTRALREGARVADADPRALLMPADGKISQAGRIEAGRIFQAKGQSFTAAELLGDEALAAPYADGWFANIYLSPRDYHRVHMPWAGTLVETLHVPGRLFTVAPWGVQAIPRLFARNERLVCHFETEFGPMCSVMVGALLVSGVESVWNGEEIPPYAHKPVRRDWRGQGITLGRFAEMARFNYGSTVILLFPRDAVRLDPLATETPTRVGQRLGTVL